jgi:replication factor C subunit 2/4
MAIGKVDSLIEDGYNSYDIINVISRVIQDSTLIEEEFRFDLLKEVSITKMRVLDGIDSVAQIYGCVAEITEMCMIYSEVISKRKK